MPTKDKRNKMSSSRPENYQTSTKCSEKGVLTRTKTKAPMTKTKVRPRSELLKMK